MGMTIQGYVLEPPRMGASNSPYTTPPDTVILDNAAYSAHFTDGSESVPRVEYFVTVVPDGTYEAGRFLEDAKFAWTKNQGTPTRSFARFSYDNASQSFKLLPGSRLEALGSISTDLNTNRLTIPVPIEGLSFEDAPYRLSYGAVGSGTTLTLEIVTTFGLPPSGTVQLNSSTGELNWNEADLAEWEGLPIRFQQQSFYSYAASKGYLGLVLESLDPGICLNPLPGPSQYPMLRFDNGLWLNPIMYPTEANLSDPPQGSVAWSAETGLLRFNPQDIADNTLKSVYYDGVFLSWQQTLPRQLVGTLGSPGVVSPLPPEGGDLIFRIPPNQYTTGLVGRFPVTKRVDEFQLGSPPGTIQVRNSDGKIEVSVFDAQIYGPNKDLEIVRCDLPLDYGLGVRFYRNIINLDGGKSTPRDVTLYYESYGQTKAILSPSVVASPFVSLPSLPTQDSQFPIRVYLEYGRGLYAGELYDLSLPDPLPGYGYILDYEARQLNFAHRKKDAYLPIRAAVSALALPDPLILGSNYKFELENEPGINQYTELEEETDYLLEPNSGVLTFTETAGKVVGMGVSGTLQDNIFQDTSSTVTAQSGDLLVVLLGPAKGTYRMADGDLATGVLVDLSAPYYASVTEISYEIRRAPEVAANCYWEPVTFTDPNTTVEKVRLIGTAQNQSSVCARSGTFPDTQTLEDLQTNFEDAGVQVGDTLRVLEGPDIYTSHVIVLVTTNQLFFSGALTDISVELAYEVVRRLNLPIVQEELFVGAGTGHLTDLTHLESTQDFKTLGVQVGDTLLVTYESNGYNVAYRVSFVTPYKLTVETNFFAQSSPVSYKIYRRALLPSYRAYLPRFRFGETAYTLASNTSLVLSDASFTNPTALSSFHVEVSLETGNLNFSSQNLTDGPEVRWLSRLKPATDYRVQPTLGFIDFTERFAAGEEVLVTYVPLDSSGNPLPSVVEQGTFAITKELIPPRQQYTSVVSFNPANRKVASQPPPKVYRNGRPQTSKQCRVNTETSRITFLPDESYQTDALPHGAVLGITERIYVDYNVYGAVGGEQSITLLKPMSVVQVSLVEDANTFSVEGDYTAILNPGRLFKVENNDIYQVETAVYPSPSNQSQTLITLKAGQSFAQDSTNPKIYRTSVGTARSQFDADSFFVLETVTFRLLPRGMNRLRISGDRLKAYPQGTVLLFTDSAGTFTDYYEVVSATLGNGITEIILSRNAQRQYTPEQAFIRYSVRPIPAEGAFKTLLQRPPLLSLPTGVFRRTLGQPGQVLEDGYSLDDSGVLVFDPPLTPQEEIGVWYTGGKVTTPGTNLRYTYTHSIVPSSPATSLKFNGFLDQVLTMEYTVWNPDSFFFRVETLTNFTRELTQYFLTQSQGTSVVSGPRLSNSLGESGLASKGRESDYYAEKHLSNQDLVARRYLKYANDTVNNLEDTLQSFDGRLVGADSGRFKFDGKIDNPKRTIRSTITNDLDDSFKVGWTWAWLGYTFGIVDVYKKLWESHDFSRIYPTNKAAIFNITVLGSDTPDIVNGTPILQFDQTGITSWPGALYRRYPRGLVTEDLPAGSTVIPLDNATGTFDLFRPPFEQDMKVRFVSADGSILCTGEISADPLPPIEAVTLKAGTSAAIPRGTTLTLNTLPADQGGDTVYQKTYSTYWDVTFANTNGTLLYVDPWFGDSGSPKALEILQLDNVGILNRLTAPNRFPALDGLAESDSNDTGIPMKTRTFECEATYLGDEDTALLNLASLTTPTDTITDVAYVSTPVPTLTRATGWGSPAVQPYDLVRFVTGPNASAGWRQILTVNPTTLILDAAFPSPTTSDEILTTAAPNVTQGVCTFLFESVIDSPALSSAQVGQTVIFTNPADVNGKERRQIVDKAGNTTVILDHPVTFPSPSSNFRVSNHISTFNALDIVKNPAQQVLYFVRYNDHNINPGYVDSENLGIRRFLDGDLTAGTDGILTDSLPAPTQRTASVSGTELTDSTTDFAALSVSASDYVYVESGDNQGFYQIAEAGTSSPNTLTVAAPFPVVGSVTYRVVSAAGVSFEGLADLQSVLKANNEWADATESWIDLLGLVGEVVGPSGLRPSVYVNDLVTQNLLDRQTAALDRQSAISGPLGLPAKVEQTLGDRDQLYNKRYVWIDGRANVLKGFLYMRDRAIKTRQDNMTQRLNDLTKLNSMGG